MAQQFKCPTCGRLVSKKANGQFYPHAIAAGSFVRYAGARCSMSNKAPTPSEGTSNGN